MNKQAVLRLMCIGCLLTLKVLAKPQVIKTIFPTKDVVIAEAVLQPLAEASQDASALIQAAIDNQARAGGGTIFLAQGVYTIATPLVVREGVTLRGDYLEEKPMQGTLFCIVAGKNQEAGTPAFSLERGAGLMGLAFWYPEQSLTAPLAYPWTVKSANMPANDNQTVAACTFVNAWQAIAIGPEGNELHTFRELAICALKTGISIDSTTDIGRISQVLLSPEVWSNSGAPRAPQRAPLQSFMLSNKALAVDFGRSDWEYIWRLKVRGYDRGLVFRQGKLGKTNAVMLESDFRDCRVALEIQTLNEVGFSAYVCNFSGNQQAFLGSADFDTVAQFANCRFEGRVWHQGSGFLSLQGCDLQGASLNVERGQLTALHCDLRQVELGAACQRVRLLDFDDQRVKINNQVPQAADVVIEAQAGVSAPRANLSWRSPVGTWQPSSSAMWNVADFGASTECEDCSAPFQAALNMAAAHHGGTVYVPAGHYRFKAGIRIPSGVELRGCSDVPHHTVSGGTMLLAYYGHGAEDGQPLIEMDQRAGLRGLTIWYPEQILRAPVAYPWSVRTLGAGCWLRDVTLGNAWQGVDMATHPSDNHYVSYLAGGVYRRGIIVGKSKAGWVEDIQFNPHYALRLPRGLPHVYGEGRGGAGDAVIQFQRQHLDGIVLQDTQDEWLRGTFLYAAYDGLALKGTTQATVFMHGSDTASRGLYCNLHPDGRVALALTQLVALGDWVVGAIVGDVQNQGRIALYNTQIWAGPCTLEWSGGQAIIEQFNTVSGLCKVNAGRVHLANGHFDRHISTHIDWQGAAQGNVFGTIYKKGRLNIHGDFSQAKLKHNSR